MSFGPKTIEEAKAYRYGAWAGSPNGRKYEAGKCMEEVSGTGRDMMRYQCSRNIWKDGFCKQHHPDTIKAKQEASEQKYQAERERDRKEQALQSAAPDMLAALELAEKYVSAVDDQQASTAPEDRVTAVHLNQIRAAITKAKGEA